ncbi:MAG: HD domain-containing phosphohydrolase [Ilumatobacteraceae bacterium]
MSATDLVASERLLAAVLGASGAATIATSMDGAVEYWNDAATALFGWTAAEATGRRVVELTTAPHTHGDVDAIMAELSDGRSWSGEFWLAHRDGRTFPAHVTDSPVFDDHGELVGIVGVTVDLTAQHASAKAASDQDLRYRRAFDQTIEALSVVVEYRDPYLAGHQRDVAQIGVRLCRELGRGDSFTDGVRVAGLLHDIGKVTVPNEILSRPGRLTAPQLALVQEHAQAGFDICSLVDWPWPVATAVLQHHERLDGSGYPNGLAGEDICPEARILAVADVVDACVRLARTGQLSDLLPHRPERDGHG